MKLGMDVTPLQATPNSYFFKFLVVINTKRDGCSSLRCVKVMLYDDVITNISLLPDDGIHHA
jgi:hypothetical protein